MLEISGRDLGWRGLVAALHLLASVPVTDSPLSSDVFAAAVDTITDETTVPPAPPQLGNVR
jgi:hypothetical protein